ncbi:hypothetical protein EKO23_07665 [Nocardioides guangzhouensis]|uniref:YbjN domain-containing protein n=1 Tax=Nocardioides guangzhouensis TaxID=2497878 RepID=A0A4Q4ZHL5_9ACTN|nr:YbjN domain-containing protein [Nocardioides guangzhouensis]RYP86844.1 hypothetical protein EKO23_07665 [Nocardioides guangzhouensis]
MGDETGATAPYEWRTDEAWAEFRRQLADHVAGMRDDDLLHIELEQARDEDALGGVAPYLQMVAWGEGAIRAEVCSNTYLDDRFRLGQGQERRLVELGWELPTYGRDDEPDHGSPLWWADVEVREADRLAVMCVGALREVYGCPHPAFLVVDGFDPVGFTAPEPHELPPAEPVEPALVMPQDRDELVEAVDRALGRVYGEPVKHDSDGDVPIVLGESMLFIRVSHEEPMVELFADLVIGVEDREAAAREVALLNRNLLFGTVILRDDDTIALKHFLYATPFVPRQFRAVLDRMISDLDRNAADLVARVGGERFLSPARFAPATPDDDEVERLYPPVATLRELLAAGEVDPRTVAALFDGDLDLITEQIEALRQEPPSELDVAEVIAALQAALQFVAVRRSRELWDRTRRPAPRPRPTSHQPPLLSSDDVGERTLDLGAES